MKMEERGHESKESGWPLDGKKAGGGQRNKLISRASIKECTMPTHWSQHSEICASDL